MKTLSLGKVGLIGGAMLCTSAANAQNIAIIDHNTFVYAYDWFDFDPYITNSSLGAGAYSTTAASNNAIASASGNANGFSAFASSDGTANQAAYVNEVYTAFTVDANGTLNVDWDFTGDIFGFSGLTILENGSPVFAQGFGSSGNVNLAVSSDALYEMYGTLFNVDGAPTTYWNATIPAPGAVALIGIAGLMTSRRRRA